MSVLFKVPLSQTVFLGDAYDMNDEAAIKAVSIVGNVGKWIDITLSRFYRSTLQFFQLADTGPGGFVKFCSVIFRAA